MGGRGGVVYGVLGPVTAQRGVQPVELGPFKQRVLLALLLCRANAVVPVADLVDCVWPDGPPRTAVKNVQVYVSQLRKLLHDPARPAQPAYRPPGYHVGVEPPELDVFAFEDLARAGRLDLRSGDPHGAADALRSALELWRGPALADLVTVPRLRREADRLEERRVSVYEDWFEAELALGRETAVLDELEELTRAHPTRERLRGLQMTALFRSGRQAAALAVFDEVRQLLARELGLPPTPALRRLYEAVLAGDPGLDPITVPAPRRAAPEPVGAEVVAHAAALPRAVDDFTGRGRALDTLAEVHGGGGLSVLHGLPGVGKTALALQVAARLRSAYPDGQVLVVLRGPQGRPRPVAEVQAELLRAFGLPVAKRQPDRAARLRSWLADRRVLLVLDDAADEAQVRPLLPGMGGSGALVTSRRLLGGLEAARFVPVDPLGDEDAMALFGRIVGADRIAAEPGAARQIVRACGAVPLAVRIAGTKLLSLRQVSLAGYASRLAHPGRRLDELTVRDLTLRPGLAALVRELPADERALLVYLGTSARPEVSLAEVAASLDRPAGRLQPVAERLIGAHALTELPGPAGRYRLPELLRLYVQELADPGAARQTLLTHLPRAS